MPIGVANWLGPFRRAHRWARAVAVANLLYLVHRLPYPPNKGDKVRSYHLLQPPGASSHRVFLGTFVDDPDDEPHVATLCASGAPSVHAPRLHPRSARSMASLAGLLKRDAADAGTTTASAGHAGAGSRRAAHSEHGDRLRRWCISSSMAPYAEGFPRAGAGGLRRRRFGQVDRVRRQPPLADVVAVSPRGPHACWPTSVPSRRSARPAPSSAADKEAALFAAAWRPRAPRRVDRRSATASTHAYWAPRCRPAPRRRTHAGEQRSWSSPAQWTTGPTSTP